MCALNPDNTSLILPVAQAAIITVPFFFRTQIAKGVRRATGRPVADEPASSSGDDCDTRPDDDLDGPEPPGTIRP
jgi:hypothetical protein